MPRFLISREDTPTLVFDQEKIKLVKPIKFGLEVHFTNGRVIIVDGKTIDLDYSLLANEVNNDLKLKRSTGIHAYVDHTGPQMFINNDRYD